LSHPILRRAAWGGIALTILVALVCYAALVHPLSVRVHGLPPAANVGATGLGFAIIDAKTWGTSRFTYLEVEAEERGWEGVRHLIKTGAFRSAQLMIRIAGPLQSGGRHAPTEANGFFIFHPGDGSMVIWGTAPGSVRLLADRKGIAASAQLSLVPMFPEAEYWPPASPTSTESLTLRKLHFRGDRGTAINIFTPRNQRFAPGLQEWLNDDPDLIDVIPVPGDARASRH